MNKTQFEELLSSVKEMDAIVAGKQMASRVIEYPEPEVKAVREKASLLQARSMMPSSSE